jgi:HPt (histidine-containing phosphotransfer) domain-containing protein
VSPAVPVPGVDEEVLSGLRALSGPDEPDFVGNVLRTFLQQGDRNVATLRALAAKRDLATLVTLAHGWKGSSGLVGATDLASACAEAERAAKCGDARAAAAAVESVAVRFAAARRRFEAEIERGTA